MSGQVTATPWLLHLAIVACHKACSTLEHDDELLATITALMKDPAGKYTHFGQVIARCGDLLSEI